MIAEERLNLPLRLRVLQWSLAAVFLVLAIAFWYFQVARHQQFLEMAENNHQRALPLQAPRGVLFDRRGAVLVENRYAFNISIVREQVSDLARTTRLVAQLTGTPIESISEALERSKRLPTYRPTVVIRNVTEAQIAAVAAHRLELPGVIVEKTPTRRYPSESMAAHLIGYVGEVTDAQLARPEYREIPGGAIVGQAGVEQTYNPLLMGSDGARHVVVNSRGREIDVLGEEEPVEGRRLQLTIDADVQRAAEEAFRHYGFRGAAIALAPRSGEVLALSSLPAYDPNAFAAGIGRAEWNGLLTDPLRPLNNRAIQGRYSPGSTFKIAVAVAGLQEHVITPDTRIFCGGGASFYGRFFKCHKAGGHGSVAMREAIEKSCNVYFYTLGNILGVDRIHKWATALGLGEMSGIDLPHETRGIIPSTAWKKQRTGEKWYAGETISVSIGQGQVSVTPISLAVMMASVANGGTRIVPHLVRAVDNGKGWEQLPAPEGQHELGMEPANVDVVREGLWMVVNGAGTGGRGRIVGYDVGGKTGTAQVISNQGKARAKGDRDLRDHGWFVFFAPAKNPTIAGVVFAEHSEHGFNAAPIAKFMMETWFAKEEGRPLPTLGPPPAGTPGAAGTTVVAQRPAPPRTPAAPVAATPSTPTHASTGGAR
ncbi:penicillin-binding protein 2 [Luteitalea sp. TBR-22]|uniref:penicillin-binding protein 2 n=1 Tax=Luteitalea sp. TBR-22 TaxID=2802971 RepID=UPI001AF8110A|nr:penicillin-binding protein 2 [Luteitalea sp. TBR-22]BCS34499.1 penicillin-binding protein 2 [Luteitalea sp. TBR-22]